jgi:hypothetical protein
MKDVKLYSASLNSFIILLVGLGVFAFRGDIGSEAFGQGYPRVIFLGDPDERPELRDKLPVGYVKDMRGFAAIEFNVISTDPKDPNMMFEISDKTDTRQQLKAAVELGKENVYFTYEPKLDPDIEWEPFIITGEQLTSMLFPPLRLITFDFFGLYPENASANTLGDPPSQYGGWNCTQNCAPPGTYNIYFFAQDCGLSNQKVKIVNKNMNVYSGWMGSVMSHQSKNAGRTQYPIGYLPYADCFDSHNGSGFMCEPVNLTFDVYRNSSDLPPGNACGWGGPGQKTTPRKSINETVIIALKSGSLNCDLDKWSVGRHEIGHSYGYSHTDRDNNVDHSRHCETEDGYPEGHSHVYF